jgi:altronate dehydratase small subunit
MSKRIEPPAVDAIILDDADHVATALRPVSAGETISVGGPGGLLEIIAAETVPLCHKIAVKAVKSNEAVYKYGEFIGEATRTIAPGEHVHIHNIRGRTAS